MTQHCHVRLCGWEDRCEKSSVCVYVTFLSCHQLYLPLLCTFSIKQQSVIRARQRKMGKKTGTFYLTSWGNWHSSSAVMVSHTANSCDIPGVCEKLTHQKICTMGLCSSWVGGGWGRDTRVMRWQVQEMDKLQSLVVDTCDLSITLTVAVTSEGMVYM